LAKDDLSPESLELSKNETY